MNKKLFNLFLKHRNEADLFEAVEAFIEIEIENARGRVAAEQYNTLRLLSNSINNSGWQDRHSEQIDTINEAMFKIVDGFDVYLS